MNNQDVIAQLAEKTGVDDATCDKIMKQLEQVAGGAVLGAATGKKPDAEALADKISGQINVPRDICVKVIDALDGVLNKGLKDKLNPFK